MSRLAELLDEAVGTIRPSFELSDVEARAAGIRRRRRHLRWALGLGVVAVVSVVGALVLTGRGQTGLQISSGGAPQGVFPEPTGAVLILADGYDGATLVDLDHRVAVRRPIQGARAGDAPYSFTRVGDALVVGWGDIYAAPLDGSPSRLLGQASIYIPAAEPDRVWLVDYPGDGTLRQVDLSGRVLVQAAGLDPSRYIPALGIPGGVAYETRNGAIALYDATTGRITAGLGAAGAAPVAVHDNLLAWCDTICTRMHISRLGGGPDVAVSAPGANFEPRSAQFSPDGRYLAVVAGDTGPGGHTTGGHTVRAKIVLINTTTGASRVVTVATLPFLQLAWSPDSGRLFFTSTSYQEPRTTIGEYLLKSGTTHVATANFGGAIVAVVADRSQVSALLRSPLGKSAQCLPPMIWPSGRTGPCSFRF